METLRVAVIQHGPVYLDKAKSLDKATTLLQEAAAGGAGLVVFGETWLSGYPAWLDHCPDAGRWNHEPVKEVFAQTWQNGVAIDGPEITTLRKEAAAQGVAVVMGINEVVHKGQPQGTIFNSLIIIDEQGNLANHHRKLMPTYTEKLVYGHGDGAGLRAADTKFGRLGALICWEHWMPHSRMAMHQESETVHVALWPTVHEMHQINCRQYAFEGRCFVIGAGQIMRASELPEALETPSHFANAPDALVLNGGSCVIGPDGHYVAGPVFDKETILYADLDLSHPVKERMNLDVTGHYNRPDVFSFSVNRERQV